MTPEKSIHVNRSYDYLQTPFHKFLRTRFYLPLRYHKLHVGTTWSFRDRIILLLQYVSKDQSLSCREKHEGK